MVISQDIAGTNMYSLTIGRDGDYKWVYVYDTWANQSWVIAEYDESSEQVVRASNLTATLMFMDKDGNWLFNITWTIMFYSPRTMSVTETVTAGYDVLVLEQEVARVGFDKSGGWLQPECTIVVDEEAWRFENATAAYYGATAYYEAEEGVLLDTVPVVVGSSVEGIG